MANLPAWCQIATLETRNGAPSTCLSFHLNSPSSVNIARNEWPDHRSYSIRGHGVPFVWIIPANSFSRMEVLRGGSAGLVLTPIFLACQFLACMMGGQLYGPWLSSEFIFFSIMAVANDCFRRWLYVFNYLPKSKGVLLYTHIHPLLLNETGGQRQLTSAVPSNFTLLCTPAPPNLDCSPPPPPLGCWSQVCSRLISVSSWLISIVGRVLQMRRMHGFVSVATPGRIKVVWMMDWSRFSSLFDIHDKYHG